MNALRSIAYTHSRPSDSDACHARYHANAVAENDALRTAKLVFMTCIDTMFRCIWLHASKIVQNT